MTDDVWTRSFSWSKMSAHDTCGRRFKFKYIDKLEEDTESQARDDGISFHEFMQQYYDEIGEEPNAEATVALAQKKFSPNQQARYRPWIENWHYFNERVYDRLGPEHWKPKYTEKWIEVEIDDLDNKYIDTEHWEGDVHHGFVDAIWYDPVKGGYGVVDYKPKAKTGSRIKGQTTYYAKILVELWDEFDHDIEWAGTYGYKEGVFKQWDIAWQSVKAVGRKVDRLKSLDNGYEPVFDFHCQFCPFIEECQVEESRQSSSLLDA